MLFLGLIKFVVLAITECFIVVEHFFDIFVDVSNKAPTLLLVR
jgi:hypothetical protein